MNNKIRRNSTKSYRFYLENSRKLVNNVGSICHTLRDYNSRSTMFLKYGALGEEKGKPCLKILNYKLK